MRKFIDSMAQRAKADKKTIVLPEGYDMRTLEAAERVLAEGVADVILLGNPDEIAESGYSLEGARIVDPGTSPLRNDYARKLAKIRASKGMDYDEAYCKMADEVYFGIMMVHEGEADGMVSGACHATADIFRPVLQILETAPDTNTVSAFFVMDVPDCDYGDGTFIFADCALNEDPTPEKLAEIAISSAESYKKLIGGKPQVALLSYSTYGSAQHERVDKVKEATRIAKEKAPSLMLDGDLQADAAIVPEIGARKAPGSAVAGSANVLIFPDLDSGNIAYKLVQRLAKAEAYGPIVQGISKPVNDLSRGCSADDIFGVIAITCVQAQGLPAGR